MQFSCALVHKLLRCLSASQSITESITALSALKPGAAAATRIYQDHQQKLGNQYILYFYYFIYFIFFSLVRIVCLAWVSVELVGVWPDRPALPSGAALSD